LHWLRHGDFDPVYVNDLIFSEGITIMNCTPFSFYLLVDPETDSQFSAKLRSLRVLNLGGEAIVAENLRVGMTVKMRDTSGTRFFPSIDDIVGAREDKVQKSGVRLARRIFAQSGKIGSGLAIEQS